MPRKQTLQIPEDFLELIPPGGFVLFALPDAYVARRFVPAFLATSRKSSKLALFTSLATSSYPLPNIQGPSSGASSLSREGATPAAVIPLDSFKSSSDCVKALGAAGKRRGISVILDLTGETPGWLSSTDSRERFVRVAAEILRGARCRSLFLLTENLLEDSHWARLKSEASAIVVLRPTGDEFYCQMIAATGVYDPEQFLPRMVRLQDGAIAWGRPLVPAPDAGTPDERIERLKERLRRAESSREYRFEQSPYPQAIMSPRRILSVNAAFRSAMPWSVEEGGEPKVTPHQLFGRKNPNLLQDIFARTGGGPLAAGMPESSGTPGVHALGEVAEAVPGSSTSADSTHTVANHGSEVPVESSEATGTDAAGESERGTEGAPGAGGTPSEDARPLVRDVTIPVKDSTPLEFELSVLPLPSDDRPLVLCTFVPMGPRQKVLHDLRSSDAYLRAVLGAPSGAVMVVRDERIIYASQGFLTLFGYMLVEDLVGSEVSRIAAGRDRKAILESLSLTGGKDTPVTFDFVGATREGGRLHLSASASEAVLDGHKSVVCYISDRSAEVAAVAERERRQWEAETLRRLMVVLRDPDRFVDLAGASLDYLIKRLGADGGAAYEPREGSTVLTPPVSALGNGSAATSGSGDASAPVPGELPGSLSMVISRELAEKVVETLSTLSQTDGLGGFVSRTLEPLVLTLATYPPHIPHKNLFEREGYNSLIFIPLYSGNSLQGLVLLYSRRAFDPEASSTELLTGIADQLGAAAARVRVLDRVRASEAMFRSAAETVRDVIYQTLPNGVFRFISPQVVSLCAYQPAEITKGPDSWRNIVHPDDRVEYSRRITAGAQGSEGVDLEYRVLPKGKAAYRWVRDSVRYLRAADGTVETINGIVSDITEHIELERRLSRSEELKRHTIGSVQEGVVVFGTDLRCIDWNQAMEVLTGRKRDEMLGKPADETPLPMAELRPLIARALEGERMSSQDIAVPTADGVGRWIMWARFSPLLDEEMKVRGVVGTISDVTARRSLEVEVHESEETLRNVIDAMGDALMISDLDGRVWEVNREFTLATGYERNEVLGKTFPYPWIVDDDMTEFIRWVGQLGERDSLRDHDMRWQRKDGGIVDVSMSTTLLKDAHQASVAMVSIARDITQRRSMEVEISAKSRQIEMLNRIIGMGNQTLDFAKIFEVVASEIRAMLPYDHVNVSLLLPDHHSAMLYASAGPAMEGPPVGTVVQVERTVSKLVIDGGKAVLVDDVVTHPALGPGTVPAKAGLRCHLSIPITLGERLLGTLNVASKEAGVYAATDVRVLQPIADQIGAMVERSRLYAEVQSQLSTVTHLYELASDLAGVADTVALFTVLLRHVPRSLPADSVELYELTAAGAARLVLSGTAGVPAVTRTGDDNPEIADGEIAAEARSVLLSARESGEVAAGHSGGEALLAIPVKTSGNVAEAVLLRSANPEGYGPNHLRLAGSIGSLSGIAMDRIRLYDAILAKSSEVETKNRELDDFAYVVSHDLKEPLITIEGYAKILEADYAGRLDAEGVQFLGSIRAAGVRMKSMIEDLLTLARVGRATESEESLPLGDVIGDVLQDLEFSIREKRATVTVQGDLPSVTFDRAQLGIVFRNLISNALKFNTSTDPRVGISAKVEPGEVILAVSDNGIGIDPAEHERIFRIFQRVYPRETFDGTGAGLAIVRNIVEHRGGRIWLESTVGEGSTFFFSIPRS